MSKAPILDINIVTVYDSGEAKISLSADIWLYSKKNFKILKSELEAVIKKYAIV